MTDTPAALVVPLAEAQVLNAKRYGLSKDQLSQFTDIFNNVQRPDNGGDEAEEQVTSSDLIKDYILQRMSNRMDMEEAFSQDAQRNPFDMMMDLIGKPREKSSNLSGLLNMHFDLNTLQMLNKT